MRSLVATTVVLTIMCSTSLFSVSVSGQPDLGVWSTPVQISSSELFRGDLWGSDIYEYGWDSLAVSNDGGSSWNPEVPFDGKLCASDGVLYRVNISDVPELSTLVFSKSTDHGSSWSDPVVIMYPAGSDGAYRIARFDSTLIVYGFVDAGTSYGYIKASRSTDDGLTWSPAVIVDSPVHCEDPLSSAIVYLAGKVYITYYDYNDIPVSYSHIVVIESPDLGASWGDRRVVGSGYSPMIAADSRALYVTFWVENGIGLHFTTSADGDTWTVPLKVGDVIQGTDSQVPHSVTAFGGVVCVAYITYDNPGGVREYWVHVNYSGDSGQTWEDLGGVTNGDGDEILPNIMLNATALHLTWVDELSLGGVTYYRSLTFYDEIPEFAGIVVPVLGAVMIAVSTIHFRRRR